MPSVLFVCRANQFRSPLAAACLQRAIKQVGTGTDWVVESAGTWTKPGLPVPQVVLQVTHRLGLPGAGSWMEKSWKGLTLSS
jgi:protein-tyrosine phosphatase